MIIVIFLTHLPCEIAAKPPLLCRISQGQQGIHIYNNPWGLRRGRRVLFIEKPYWKTNHGLMYSRCKIEKDGESHS